MATVVREIFARIGFLWSGDAALRRLTTGLDQARGIIGETTQALGLLNGALSLGGGGAFAFVQHTAEANQVVRNLSDSIGLSVERLQEWEYAFGTVGTDIRDVRGAFLQFAGQVQQAASSPTSDLAKIFGKVGVEIRDSTGQLRSFDALLADAFLGLGRMDDGIEKTGGALAFFGEDDAAKMLPVIQMGREGINGLIQEARTLGVVLDQQASDTLRRYTLSMAALTGTVSGLGKGIAVSLAGPFSRLADTTKRWILQNQQLIKQPIETTLKALGQWLGEAIPKAFKLLDWTVRMTEKAGGLDQILRKLADGLRYYLVVQVVRLGIVLATTAVAAAPLLVALAAAVALVNDFDRAASGSDNSLGDWLKTMSHGEGLLGQLSAGLADLYVDLALLDEGLKGNAFAWDALSERWGHAVALMGSMQDGTDFLKRMGGEFIDLAAYAILFATPIIAAADALLLVADTLNDIREGRLPDFDEFGLGLAGLTKGLDPLLKNMDETAKSLKESGLVEKADIFTRMGGKRSDDANDYLKGLGLSPITGPLVPVPPPPPGLSVGAPPKGGVQVVGGPVTVNFNGQVPEPQKIREVVKQAQVEGLSFGATGLERELEWTVQEWGSP